MVKRVPERAPLLRAEEVVKHFPAGLGASVKAVERVNFEIYPGETVGLVGESGCGKSTLGRLITQLLPVTSGNIFFEGVDLTKLSGEKLRQKRRELQMIFQDPYSSLNPRMTVGDIIAEPLENFGLLRGRAKDKRVQELLRIVGLNPYHPYTKALLSSIPIPDPEIQSKRRIVHLSGEIPSPVNPPSGCRFHPRCPIAQVPTPCADLEPPLEEKARGHRAACHFSEKVPVAV